MGGDARSRDDRLRHFLGRRARAVAARSGRDTRPIGRRASRLPVLDLDSPQWRRLPNATGIVRGSFAWSWDGSRVVSPSRLNPYGGSGGRLPFTTSGALDP